MSDAHANKLIVFTGVAGAGKSTARDALLDMASTTTTTMRFGVPLADMLRTTVEPHWAHVSFAEPLKAMLRALLAAQGLTPAIIARMIDGDLKEMPVPFLNGRSPRYAMQTLGTEWGRELIHPDLWIDIACERITTARRRGANVVVDDCRFPNEAAMLADLGARFIRIEGRGGIGTAHASEQGVENCDAVVLNTGSVAVFREAVRATVLT
jgi:hypothetical protein